MPAAVRSHRPSPTRRAYIVTEPTPPSRLPDANKQPVVHQPAPPIGIKQGAVALLVLIAVSSGIYAAWGPVWATVLASPFAAGLLGAWLGRDVTQRILIITGLASLLPIAFGIFELTNGKNPIGGLFCGAIGMVLLVPGYATGYLAGSAVRRIDKKRTMLRPWAAALFVPALPVAIHIAQLLLALPVPAETVSFSKRVAAPADALFTATILNDNRDAAERGAYQLGMTRPRAAHGRASAVGDKKTFAFNDGHLSVVVTESDFAKRFAFSVTEQHHVEDRAARFEGGRMTFEDLNGQTQVVMSLTYQPLMTPRWLVRGAERWAAQTVMEDVVHRMAGAAKLNESMPVAKAPTP